MRDVQTRAVDTIEQIVSKHPRELVVVVSHADVIKMVLAHFLGMHLDAFQRIMVAPASISSLSLGYGRPNVASVNDTAHLMELERSRRRAKTAPPASL
jgi:probable phosphoglycerate mutase